MSCLRKLQVGVLNNIRLAYNNNISFFINDPTLSYLHIRVLIVHNLKGKLDQKTVNLVELTLLF